jgi:hypothetical protein
MTGKASKRILKKAGRMEKMLRSKLTTKPVTIAYRFFYSQKTGAEKIGFSGNIVP